jgi:hypothetical protein
MTVIRRFRLMVSARRLRFPRPDASTHRTFQTPYIQLLIALFYSLIGYNRSELVAEMTER